MAGGITVTPEQLQSISMQLTSGEDQIDSILSQLRTAVAPLGSDWVGTAQVQFEDLWTQWQNQARGLHEALSGIAQLTLRAAEAYSQTEQSITSSFQG
ncbi:MAG: WXG100 family type VII secretion target [Ferrimicrobium sp.]